MPKKRVPTATELRERLRMMVKKSFPGELGTGYDYYLPPVDERYKIGTDPSLDTESAKKASGIE